MTMEVQVQYGYSHEAAGCGLSRETNSWAPVLWALQLKAIQSHFPKTGIPQSRVGLPTTVRQARHGYSHEAAGCGLSRETNSWAPVLWVLHFKAIQSHFPQTGIPQSWVGLMTMEVQVQYGYSHVAVGCGLSRETNSWAQGLPEVQVKEGVPPFPLTGMQQSWGGPLTAVIQVRHGYSLGVAECGLRKGANSWGPVLWVLQVKALRSLSPPTGIQQSWVGLLTTVQLAP